MFKRFLIQSIRAFQKQKQFCIINITGLSISIASSLIIAAFVFHELSYDRYHEKKDRIYRLVLDGKIGEQGGRVTATPAVIGPTMYKEYPEVEGFLRINSLPPSSISYGEINLSEENIIEADSSFFDFFSFKLIAGDPKTCLSSPGSMVLSSSMAMKIFGSAEALNRELGIGSKDFIYTVTGVYEDIPLNTHLRPDVVLSFMTNPRSRSSEWMSNSFDTYLLLNQNTLVNDFEKKIPALVDKYIGVVIKEFMGVNMNEFKEQGNWYRFFLQPLPQIHLDPSIGQVIGESINPRTLYVFASIALLIILIAGINYTNLLTSQSTRRSKEIAIKKTCGCSRSGLVRQFLGEALVLSFIALFLALVISAFTFPYFSGLVGIDLQPNLFGNIYTVPLLLVFTIMVGVLSGIYPAVFISSIKPVRILRGGKGGLASSGRLRSILVIFQFAVTIILITGSLFMFNQIGYMNNKDKGYDSDHLIIIEHAEIISDKLDVFKAEIKKIPGVLNVTVSTAIPGHNNNNSGYRVEGREDVFLLETNWVDHDFLDTYRMSLESGRFFTTDYSTDKQACLLNASAVETYKLTEPLSERIEAGTDINGEMQFMHVIGILDNFHFRSLHNTIQPYIMMLNNHNLKFGYVSVRLSDTGNQDAVIEIEQTWKQLSEKPINYFFMDKDLKEQYRQERSNASLALIFSFISIAIAILGLYGQTTLSVQQRIKELAIRKTLGASTIQLFFMMVNNILKKLAVSVLISWPVTFIILTKWLQNFPYRISLSWLHFFAGLIIAALIVIGTISWRIIKAVRVVPALALKHE